MNNKAEEMLQPCTFEPSDVWGGGNERIPTVVYFTSDVPLPQTTRFNNAERLLEMARTQVIPLD